MLCLCAAQNELQVAFFLRREDGGGGSLLGLVVCNDKDGGGNGPSIGRGRGRWGQRSFLSLSLSLSLSHRRIGRGGKDAENEQWGGGGRDSTEFVKHTSFVLPT